MLGIKYMSLICLHSDRAAATMTVLMEALFDGSTINHGGQTLPPIQSRTGLRSTASHGSLRIGPRTRMEKVLYFAGPED